MGRHEHSSSRQTVSSTAALPGSGTRRSGATVRLSPAQLEHVVQAIQEGKVDALFVPGAESDWLFTLSGADRAYRLLIEDMSEGALTLVPDGIVAYANRHFAVVLEVPLQRIIGSRIHACFAQEGHEVLARLLRAGQRGKSSVELELLTARGGGPVLVSVSPMADDEMPGALCMVVTDLTIQKRNEAALQARQHLLRVLDYQRRIEESLRVSLAQMRLHDSALGAISQGVVITDPQARVTYVNPAFETITGYSAADMAGRTCGLLQGAGTSARQSQAIRDALQAVRPFHGELLNYRKDGTPFWNELSITPVFDDHQVLTQFVGVQRDVSQRKEAENNIRQLAHYDPLTGLPNRVLLTDRATHALQEAYRNSEPVALMFIDLDRFKNVNDSLGHRIGDCLLVALAERMKSTMREQDTVSRVGGDEFVLILPNTNADGAAHLAGKLLHAARSPLQIEQHELTISPSIGIALYPNDGTDFESLAKCADAAMYRAKQNGRNTFHFYTEQIQAKSERILPLENALRPALERDEMQLYYQSQRTLCSQQIVGAEALLRSEHPQLGFVAPSEFIPIAENSGLINTIGQWVLNNAMQQVRRWIDAGMAPITVSVNLSALQFRPKNLLEQVRNTIEAAGVPARCLELESTESVAAEDPVGAIEVMAQLDACGVRMSIDDFGTGYSSLSYLKRFKVYKLKIDQSFVRNVTDNPEDQAIVLSIISLANSLGMGTIAEGVENEAQMEYLRERGCDEIQGYWLSPPLPAAAFKAFLDAHRPVGNSV